MFFVKENTKSIIEIKKEAPNVGSPYMEVGKKPLKFYRNDSAANQIFGGYCKGPENSYARYLADKYSLIGK